MAAAKPPRDHLRKNHRSLLESARRAATLETYGYRDRLSEEQLRSLRIYLDSWVIGYIDAVLDNEKWSP